jgi:glucan endo-1,3-beta-D-glucosidase
MKSTNQASEENLQRFWNGIFCELVGKYRLWWFELVRDSEADKPDWGVIDNQTWLPRIDVSCGGGKV